MICCDGHPLGDAEAVTAALDFAYKQGREQERERIIGWLRSGRCYPANRVPTSPEKAALALADLLAGDATTAPAEVERLTGDNQGVLL